VIRDAEKDARAARQSVENALKQAKVSGRAGLRIEIFILPDNQNPGMLETLCMEAVASCKELAGPNECVAQFFECLRSRGVKLPQDHRLAKHKAQAYLATREEVQLYPGTTASKNYWPWDSQAFEDIKVFLKNL